jgi:hypothetical protein
MGAGDLPRDPAAYLSRFEAGFIGTEAGRICSERTFAMARARVRPWLRPLVRPIVATLLHLSVRAAVGLSDPPSPLKAAIVAVLHIRGYVVRRLPPRTTPTTPRTRRRKSLRAEPQSAI